MSKNIKNINMIELSMESGNEGVKTELSMMQRAYARLHQTRPITFRPTGKQIWPRFPVRR